MTRAHPIPLLLLLVALGGCQDERTRLPLVRVTDVDVVQTSATVPIEFVLRDRDGDPQQVRVRYSTDGGDTFALATAAAGSQNPVPARGDPLGIDHTFVWDALADLGPGLHRDVLLELRSPRRGSRAALSPFLLIDLTDRLTAIDSTAPALAEPLASPFPDGSVWVGGGRDAGGALSATTYVFDPVTGQVTLGPSFETARADAGVALLDADGVLVAGGTGPSGALRSVERFRRLPDGTIVRDRLDDLIEARSQPALAPLAGGKAVVVGGADPSGTPVSRIEVFTPDAGAGTFATAATDARAAVVAATATRLADGRVLVAGGASGAGALLATDRLLLLAPDGSGPVEAGVRLAEARAEHAALLLPDGRVIVVGGTPLRGDDDHALASAELYDPATDTVTPAGTMTHARRRPALVYVDGEVVAFGGSGDPDAPTTAERLDLATSTWTPIAAPSGTPRPAPAAVAFGAGHALVAGGGAPPERYLADADLTGETFEPLVAVPAPRADHTATRLRGGEVVLAGGTDGVSPALASVERFVPATEAFVPAAPLRLARRAHAAAPVGKREVLVVGGEDAAGAVVEIAELYDAGRDVWSDAGALVVPRTAAAAVAVSSGRVLVFGGRDAAGVPVAAVELWRADTRAFEVIATLSEPSAELHAVGEGGLAFAGPGVGAAGPTATLDAFTADERRGSAALGAARAQAGLAYRRSARLVLVTGGADAGGPRADAVAVDVRDDAALVGASMPLIAARAGHEVAPFGQAFVLVGGRGAAGVALDSAEVVELSGSFLATRTGAPGTSRATADPHMTRPRAQHTVTALRDGRLLIVGGVDVDGVTIAGAEVLR